MFMRCQMKCFIAQRGEFDIVTDDGITRLIE